ncbi:MAG: hypothetical protein JWM11_5325 [Planctomycetaceae bacterium]|nr:hypothetical protein [Planctomycetaceae bacterium]
MSDLLRFSNAIRRDPQIETWFSGLTDPFRSLAQTWFERLRGCGADVRELFHDGCSVVCVEDAPFGYVNAFKAHVNVGFYCGAMLADPAGLLEGQGKRMRHVKLRPGDELDADALRDLIEAAYDDIRQRLLIAAESQLNKATTTMKNSKSGKKEETGGDSLSKPIAAGTNELSDWRSEMLARIRSLIKQADPEVVEDVKWRKPSNSMLGVPVWSHAGIICTGETYKTAVKMTFAHGAALEDPAGLFNSSLEGNTRRAIDFHEGDKIDEQALKTLIRAAVALNTASQATNRPVRAPKKSKSE